jgi:hypothetical protein
MQIYQFKGGDKFDFDTHIFALTAERACELFVVQLVMNGENPDQMMWREAPFEELKDQDRTQVRKALALGVEGIASRESDGRWIAVPPFDRRELDD